MLNSKIASLGKDKGIFKIKILPVSSLLTLAIFGSWDTFWRYGTTHGFQREGYALNKASWKLPIANLPTKYHCISGIEAKNSQQFQALSISRT